MGTLPQSRQESHGANSPIKGSTIDAIQDCIIGGKKPSLTRTFGPLGGHTPLPLAPANLGSNQGTSPTVIYVNSTGVVSMLVYLPCEVGDRVTGVSVRVFGDGAADCTFTPGYVDAAGVLQSPGNTVDTNRAAAWGDLVMNPWTNHVMLANEMVGIFVAINATGYRIQKWSYTYDRL